MNPIAETKRQLLECDPRTSTSNLFSKLTKYDKFLLLLFVLGLPLCNPWVRGDGVGYYSYARALLIQHNLDFRKDWLQANTSFQMGRIEAAEIDRAQYTATGHLDNHFSVGPAMLWSPFLVVAHLGVILADRLGEHIPIDGYSRPYIVAMALGTALYGFLALWISFRLARKYVSERWAFLATLGIWFASSLPVYMYFNPSWSHAHSAFTVSLFLWYWNRTRIGRTKSQWLNLGAIAGLMMDVYYLNAVLLLFPAIESLSAFWNSAKTAVPEIKQIVIGNIVFSAGVSVIFLPTLITKKLIYGSYFNLGYEHLWDWKSPAFFRVGFSAEHGLFSWTPILMLAVVGLFFLLRYDRNLAFNSSAVFAAFLYVVGCYADWHGISSFGNRFFVSLTCIFVLGLAAVLDSLTSLLGFRRATVFAWNVTALLIFWNLGLVFQWGSHLIPARGPIAWRDAAYNEVVVVPAEAARSISSYFMHRQKLMQELEEQDVKQLKSGPSKEVE